MIRHNNQKLSQMKKWSCKGQKMGMLCKFGPGCASTLIGHKKSNQSSKENLLRVTIKEVFLCHWSLIAKQREMHLQNWVKPHKPPFKQCCLGELLQGATRYVSSNQAQGIFSSQLLMGNCQLSVSLVKNCSILVLTLINQV